MDFNSILHAHHKIMADRAASNTTVRNNDTVNNNNNNNNINQTNTPPPAYSTLPTTISDPDALYISDSSSDNDDSSSPSTPPSPLHQTFTIDTSTTMHGSNNTIAVPPVDGPRLTAILLSLLHGNLPTQPQQQQQQHQRQHHAFHHHHHHHHHHPAAAATSAPSRRHPLSVRINCGVRIVGDKNVVGALAVPPAVAAAAPQRAGAGAGAAAARNGAGIPTTGTVMRTATRKRKADDMVEGEVDAGSDEDVKRGKVGGE